MLFLICLLLSSGFAYGMDGGYYVGYSSKNHSDWLKERRKQNKKQEEKNKERLKKEEKEKMKNEKQKAKEEEEQKKLQEKEKIKVEKLQRKLEKKIADTKPQAGTLGFVSFLKKSRTAIPKFDDEDKTKTL